AARPWQRGRLGAAAEHRLRMLELACSGDPRLRVNPIELQRAGNTYTIDTLAALPPTARYTWILGSDQLANFCTWHRWHDLLQYVRLAVAERPGTPATPPAELAQALTPGGLVRIPFTPQPVSATAIRQDLAAGRPVDTMLDPRRPPLPGPRNIMNLQKQQRLVIDALEDAKAQDIKVFNTTGLTGLFDRVVIASGTSNRHTRAVASHVAEQAKKHGLEVIAY